jgi:N-acetylneuraminic acid mutarotase
MVALYPAALTIYSLESRKLRSLSDLNDIWAYDSALNTWTNLKPSGTVPPARQNAAMVYDPSTHKIIMFGGVSQGEYLDDLWAYNPLTNLWTQLYPSGALPSARARTR